MYVLILICDIWYNWKDLHYIVWPPLPLLRFFGRNEWPPLWLLQTVFWWLFVDQIWNKNTLAHKILDWKVFFTLYNILLGPIPLIFHPQSCRWLSRAEQWPVVPTFAARVRLVVWWRGRGRDQAASVLASAPEPVASLPPTHPPASSLSPLSCSPQVTSSPPLLPLLFLGFSSVNLDPLILWISDFPFLWKIHCRSNGVTPPPEILASNNCNAIEVGSLVTILNIYIHTKLSLIILTNHVASVKTPVAHIHWDTDCQT